MTVEELSWIAALILAVGLSTLFVLALALSGLSKLARRWRRRRTRWQQLRDRAVKAEQRAAEAESLLDGAWRRERSNLNLLADMHALRRPFPDISRVSDADIHAWLATDPEQ
ncbi:hypothetical protein [Actinoplanes regularis]|uniref:hypothetical protein n=1 Tax=Actinoplanes regularis TaxID=52697 RepID=UPI00249FD5F8|nr:hypothetical protein [Actinoplanes regularis]GLW32246.1 hypothetical protein Areg01_51850 [Actinoplanes regularis]